MSQQSSTSGLEPIGQLVPSIYDTYICHEPAGDVPLLIQNGPDEYTASMRTLQRSADYFAEKDHVRTVERLQWEMAKVHIKYEQWERAAGILTPLWQTLSWRKAGWWQQLEEVDWALRDCASRIRNLETLIAVDWELLNNSLTPRQDWDYDFRKILEPLKPLQLRPKTIIRADSVLSCISGNFAFSALEGNVGVNLPSQIVISSQAHSRSTPLSISQIRVTFGGTLKNLTLCHDPNVSSHASSTTGKVHFYEVPLGRGSPEPHSVPSSPATSNASHIANDLAGAADLLLEPGITKVFSIDHIPRDAGDVEVASLTLSLNKDDFDLEIIVTEDEQIHQPFFWTPSVAGLAKKTLKTGRSSAVKVLPKPPKMKIEIRNVAPAYYTNEAIAIDLWVMNEESEEADVSIEARVVGSGGPLPPLMWSSIQKDERLAMRKEADRLSDQGKDTYISKLLGNLASSSKQSHGICIQALSEAAEYVVEVRARYYLLSDPETPISKFCSTNISVRLPFEVSYGFTPMIDPKPWPSLFDADKLDKDNEDDVEEVEELANGLIQKWCLTPRIYSLANEALAIEMIEPRVLQVHEATKCCIIPDGKVVPLTEIAPNDVQERSFVLDAQKLDLEDRRSSFLDLQLEIGWRRRDSSGPLSITHLAVPELVVPFGEPRVLATARNGGSPPGAVHLDYVIENPSTYVLTFSVTMDTSEEFAFSGPKNVTVELLPLSRHIVHYNLMPLVKGVFISPQLRVFDTHFQKALKIHATRGLRSEKKGLSIWVDADG